jgi:methylmalonyl-CoA mutase N-terminal domain/subunit
MCFKKVKGNKTMLKEEIMRELSRARDDWEENYRLTVKKSGEREQSFATGSGIEVKPVYTPLDVIESNFLQDLSFPGVYPYTRGIQPTMYRGRLWSMRQYAGFGTAEESNKRFKYLLEQGQTGLSVAFDLPTQVGYDSDHPLAAGEVGKVGVAIDSLADMEILFDGIGLDKVSTSMTINAPAAVLLAMYVAVAEKQGVKPEKLTGTIQNDILKEFVARGTYIFPPEPSLRLITDIFAYCAQNMPRFNSISVSGYHMREAGATAVQEIAFSFANAVAYLKAAQQAGLAVDQFASRISWIFNTHNNFFEEVAKYRAARRLWARIMRERFGAKDPRSWLFRVHVQNGGSTLTAQQPLNNIIRSTLHALATVLGGVQSMAICSFDEALCIPTEQSATLSLRTQQIIAYESGVADTIDPMGGSYFLESLTGQMENKIGELLEKIESMGGAVAAVEQGYFRREIDQNAYRCQKEIEEKQRIIVGVNEFAADEKISGVEQFHQADPRLAENQISRLHELKQRRDGTNVARALEWVRQESAGSENLMPPILEAVKAYATLGEICDVLRQVFGEYSPEEQ